MRLRLTACEVDLEARVVYRAGASLPLSPHEAGLLGWLIAHAGRAVPRQELLVEVWGYRKGLHTRAVDNTVMRLRAKIEANPEAPDHLLTVRGVGYRWQAPAAGAPTGLIGRGPELALLKRRLAEGHRLISVVGPGGVGKTTLARAVGGELCDLGSARGLEDLRLALARALHLSPRGDGDAIGDALASYPPGAIILDSFEGVREAAAAAVAAWAGRLGPGRALLVTSREPLGTPGEQVLRLEPLDEDQALQLLLARAGPLDEGLGRALVRRLDGLPLAIELAASWLDLVAPEQLLGRIEHIQGRKPGIPDRHRTMAAVMEASWELLGPHERACLAALSVFRGGFDLEAAEGVAGVPGGSPVLVLLGALADKSLLRRRDGGRFELLDTIRQFAASRLNDRATVERRHAEWFTARALGWWEATWRLGDPEARARLDAELDNLLAIERRFLYREPTLAAIAASAAFPLLYQRQAPARLLERVERLLERLPQKGSELRAELLRERAVLRLGLGEAALGRADLERATAMLEPIVPVVWRRYRCHLANLYLMEDRLDEARALLEDVAASDEDAWARGHATGYLGTLCWRQGDVARASERWSEAARILGAAGLRPSADLFRRYAARADLELGRLVEAGAVLRRAMAQARARDDTRLALACGLDMARILHAEGDLDEALALLDEAVSVFRAHDEGYEVAAALTTRARIHLELGTLAAARADLDEARERLPATTRARLALDELNAAEALCRAAERRRWELARGVAAGTGLLSQRLLARAARGLASRLGSGPGRPATPR